MLSHRESLSSGSYSTGQLCINGKKFTKNDFGKIAAFVQQDDVLTESLTARELFTFAAKIRLNMDDKTANKRVDQILERLSLVNCQNTRVGGYLGKRGVSGGERKRVSIGYELITNPSLLFLDEPTSGLDSFTALKIIKLLKR